MPTNSYNYADFQQFQQEAFQARLMLDAFGTIAAICKQRDRRRSKWKAQLLKELAQAIQASHGILLECKDLNQADEWQVSASHGIQVKNQSISLAAQNSGLIATTIAKKRLQSELIEKASLQEAGELQINKYCLVALPVCVGEQVLAVFQFSCPDDVGEAQRAWLENTAQFLEAKIAYHRSLNPEEIDERKEDELAEKEEELKTAFAKLQRLEDYERQLAEANEKIHSLEHKAVEESSKAADHILAEKLQIAFKTIDRLEEKLNQAKATNEQQKELDAESTIKQYEARLEEAFLTIERLEKKLLETPQMESLTDSAESSEILAQVKQENVTLTNQLASLQEAYEKLEHGQTGHSGQSNLIQEKQLEIDQLTEKLAKIQGDLQTIQTQYAQAKNENELLNQQVKHVGEGKEQRISELENDLTALKGKFSELSMRNEQIKEEARTKQQQLEEELAQVQLKLIAQDNTELEQQLSQLNTQLEEQQRAFQELELAHSQFEPLVQRYQEASTALDQVQREKEEYLVKIQQLKVDIAAFKLQENTLVDHKHQLEEQHTLLATQEAKLEEFAKQKESLAAENKQLSLLQEDIKKLKHLIDDKDAALAMAHKENLSKEESVKLLQIDLSDQHKAVNQLNGVIADKDAALAIAHQESSSKEESLKLMQMELADQQTAVKQLENNQIAQQQQLEQRLQEAMYAKEAAEKMMEEHKQELDSLTHRLEELNEAEYKINAANSQVRDLSSKLNQAEYELARLRSSVSLNGYHSH